MNGLEIAAVITAIGGFLGVVGSLIINARKIEDLQKKLDDAKDRESLNRRDLVLIGEQLALTRSDAAKLALLINQLFNQYKMVAGRAPDVDLEMIAHMREVYYITGELPKMTAEAIAQMQHSDDRSSEVHS